MQSIDFAFWDVGDGDMLAGRDIFNGVEGTGVEFGVVGLHGVGATGVIHFAEIDGEETDAI